MPSDSIPLYGEGMASSIKASLTVLLASAALSAETHITGDITGMTFESGGNPYIVEQDILIPSGNKAVIKEGCVFLFKPFTGLTVHGHLIIDGTAEQPVTFTSINDGEFNSASEQLPNPFDWNGILVTRESGTVVMKNFKLLFSVYGIKSQNVNIEIDNGTFRQNGQFHFTINDKIQFVQDNIPYTYHHDDSKDSDKPEPPPQPAAKATPRGVKIARFTCLGFGIAGAAAAVGFGINTAVVYTKFDAGNYDISYNGMRRLFYHNVTGTVIGGAVGVLGFTGFGLTFLY